jgi:hypothetical protein
VNFLVMGPLFSLIHDYASGPTAVGWTLLIAGSFCLMSFFCRYCIPYIPYHVKVKGIKISSNHTNSVRESCRVQSTHVTVITV